MTGAFPAFTVRYDKPPSRVRSRIALALLKLFLGMRRHRWSRLLYQAVPKGLRQALAAVLVSPVTKDVGFGNLPGVPAPVHVLAPVPALGRSGSPVGGVNLHGYFRGDFGLGESARAYSRALLAAGYPTKLKALELDVPHGLSDTSMDAHIGSVSPHGVDILFVNPDYLQRAMDELGAEGLEKNYTIGCWFWELETVPEGWHWAIDAVDEIMVASRFVEDAFRRVTDKPISRVPLPISSSMDSGIGRKELGLPKDAFMFLVAFDFHSSVHRKNPAAAIEAFRAAFPAGKKEAACLVIKCSNGHLYPDALASLLEQAMRDDRIIVRDEVLERAHMGALQRCADAYVSLHRAEGFGLGMAECMWLGKPVIATAWSGNMEFMNASNSCLVDYRLVPVRPGEYPSSGHARWAEPDVDHASRYMRRLVDEPKYASEIGKEAATFVREHLSERVIGAQLVARLDAIHTRPRAPLSPAGADSWP